MTNRSKSTLFLIEQLIVIAVFAICAAACISILTAAYFYADDSKAASNAIIVAGSGAEIFKATGGDFNAVADILGGVSADCESGVAAAVYYNRSWQACSEENASYVLWFLKDAPYDSGVAEVISGRMVVEKITGEELVAFPVAARG